LRAAAERPAAPFVAAALRAEADLLDALRWLAAERPCFDNASSEAAVCDSRFNASVTAFERLGETVLL